MAWHLDGTYFENCNCDVLCPCGASSLTSRIKGFGLDISNEGKNGHAVPFSWAA